MQLRQDLVLYSRMQRHQHNSQNLQRPSSSPSSLSTQFISHLLQLSKHLVPIIPTFTFHFWTPPAQSMGWYRKSFHNWYTGNFYARITIPITQALCGVQPVRHYARRGLLASHGWRSIQNRQRLSCLRTQLGEQKTNATSKTLFSQRPTGTCHYDHSWTVAEDDKRQTIRANHNQPILQPHKSRVNLVYKWYTHNKPLLG